MGYKRTGDDGDEREGDDRGDCVDAGGDSSDTFDELEVEGKVVEVRGKAYSEEAGEGNAGDHSPLLHHAG